MHDIFHHLLGTCGEPHGLLAILAAGITVVKDYYYYLKLQLTLVTDYVRRIKTNQN